MSDYYCPVLEHVTAEEIWRCGTCGEHGCHLCDDSTRFDSAGEHLCEGCAPPKPKTSEAERETRMDRLIAQDERDADADAADSSADKPLA